VKRSIVVSLAASAGLAACASVPPPSEHVAAARSVVAQAEPLAARHAPVELHRAQSKLGRAEVAMANGHNLEAQRLAEQAEVDARLAWAIAENTRMQHAAAEVQSSINALKQELDRRTQ
jgi:hypothetical protein